MRFGGFYVLDEDGEGNVVERKLPDDLYEEYGEGKDRKVLDLSYLKYLNYCISFRGLEEYDRQMGRAELCRTVGVSRPTMQDILGYDADGMQKECSLPRLGTVVKISHALGCRVSGVMEFNGYEILDRYEVPPERDYSLGRLTYAPLRGMFYDMYGHEGWKEGMRRLVSFLGPHDRAMNRDDKFAVKDGNARVENWRNKVRLHLMKDEDIDLRTLYDICAILNCPLDCVVSHR